MLTMSNSVIIISEDEEVYNSLERALQYLGITVYKWKDSIKQNKKRYIILLYTFDRDLLYEWIWSKIRLQHKYINPIIAIGYHELDPTEDLRDMVFSKEWEAYVYFKVPFPLEVVMRVFKELKPLESQDQRKEDIRNYSQPLGLLNRVHHELRGHLGSDEESETKRNLAIRFYIRVKDLLLDLNCHNNLKEVKGIISKIEKSLMSDKECIKFQSITDNLFKEITNEVEGVMRNG